MQYYNNILCVEAGWLIKDADLMSKSNYDALKRRQQINVIRRSSKGTPALIEFDTLPDKFKSAIIDQFGDPYKKVKHFNFTNEIQPDAEAAEFYSNYRLSDGRTLPCGPDNDVQTEYRTNAEILNAIKKIVVAKTAKRRALGGKINGIWDNISAMVNSLNKNRFKHSLPTNARRLKDRYKLYAKNGYTALIHKGYCNDNSRKVNTKLERLILSLYTMPDKPYTSTVHENYLAFLGGALRVVDTTTGEIYDKDDFYENGAPIIISESTVWNYINDPKNRAIVDKYRSGGLEFNNTHRPHHHRHKPIYSLSKISMDDRDLPRKLHDGSRVKAYYSYDVTSGCVIGYAYSRKKTKELFIDCMRNMFRFLNQNRIGIPMEVEVEHHLVNTYKDDLMKAETVFPIVRWCNPGNSQEKHAEHFNKAKKYGYEKRYQGGIGRWYAKLEANRTIREKVFDEDNSNYKEQYYDIEELVADDIEVIEKYNNDLHPNQKKYNGMSRMDVLMHHLNPNLAKLNNSLLARYIGETVKTTIRRNQYCQVEYGKYQLPSPEVITRLQPNNYNVQAYYIPEPDRSVKEVHLYQNDMYICSCGKIDTYNTANAEKTAKDDQAYKNQSSYVNQFDTMVKEGKSWLGKTKTEDIATDIDPIEDVDVVIINTPVEKVRSLDEILNDNDDADIEHRAFNSL